MIQEIRGYLRELGITEKETIDNTPTRYMKALEEMTCGYDMSPSEILSKTFAADFDEMITISDIQFWSLCEHHMLPFFGTVAVGYVPQGSRVVGLSKIPRLVQCFARRLQMQERMTKQIGDALEEHLKPKGVGVVVTGRHLCMEIRGVKTRAETRTTYLSGCIKDKPEARAEFLEGI